MASAAFELYKCIASPTDTQYPVNTNKNPCFLSIDKHSTDCASHTIAVPTDTPNYSYEMYLKWKLTVAPDNSVTNMHFYGPIAQPAVGIVLTAGTTSTWNDPVNTASSVAVGSIDENYYGPSNYLTVIASTTSKTFTSSNLNAYSKFLVLQMVVQSTTAFRGSLPSIIFYLQYDES